MVVSLCAITISVLCFTSSDKTDSIFISFSESVKAVASSKTIMGASFRIARANVILCRSPPDNLLPLSPAFV